MKKYLPLILLLVGALVVAGVFILRGRKTDDSDNGDDEAALLDLPLEERPVISLTPTSDGHYLILKVEKIMFKPASVDYLLLYNTAEGVQQGVPGTVSLTGGKDSFEEKLLLGSESSGKFRYDEGVETGSVELKFRNDKGKLIAKFVTDFHMQTEEEELTSADGKFNYTVDELGEGVFYVTMQTVGIPPSDLKAVTSKDGYSVFSSE